MKYPVQPPVIVSSEVEVLKLIEEGQENVAAWLQTEKMCAVCGTKESYPSWYRKDNKYYCEDCGDKLMNDRKTLTCDVDKQVE